MTYREFELEFRPTCYFSDETVPPSIAMTINLAADPYETLWYTEELRLEVGASEEEARAIAQQWIDQWWAENS